MPGQYADTLYCSTMRDAKPPAVSFEVNPEDLNDVLSALEDGYDVLIAGWRGETAKVDARPHFDVQFKLAVPYTENFASGRSLEKALARGARTFDEESRPPAVTGLPENPHDWRDAALTLAAVMKEGVSADTTVELRALLPESRFRRFIEADIPDDATAYRLEWREFDGPGSTQWLLVEGPELLPVLHEASEQIISTLDRMHRHDEKIVAVIEAQRARLDAARSAHANG